MGMLTGVSWESATGWVMDALKGEDWEISMEVLKGVEWGVSLKLACM